MTKLNQRNVTALFTSDLHLREDTPVCRTDDFLKAQIKKLKFLSALQAKHNCPVLISFLTSVSSLTNYFTLVKLLSIVNNFLDLFCYPSVGFFNL